MNFIESNTGYTYTFMFKIEKIIEHNPNKVIEEWQEYKEKIEKTKKEITEIITK